MREIDHLSLLEDRRDDGDSAYRTPRAAVYSQGRPTGLTLDGAKLEAQFALEGGESLLLVSNDCPYEETLRFYLLDANYKVQEFAELGYAYTPGILRNLHVVADNELEFELTGSSRYRLRVHAQPRHVWNAAGGVSEVVRFLGKRRLEVVRETSDEQDGL